MELLIKRITNLLKIKSIVTLSLTAAFVYLCVIGRVSTDQFITLFTVVISFYFGTQTTRRDESETAVSKTETAAEDTEKTT